MLNIYTPYGDHYKVDEKGNHMIPFYQITPEWIKNHSMTYKNGSPRFTIVDLYHGTTRSWGNTRVHGVSGIWFD